MANQNVQAVIPLEGSGFVARSQGDYKKGEFRRLVNCELKAGRISNRRGIRSPAYNENAGTIKHKEGTYNHIGFWGHWSLYAGDDFQVGVSSTGGFIDMWNPQDLITYSVTEQGFHKVVGFFEYNKYNYWIVQQYSTDAASMAYHVVTSINDKLRQVPPAASVEDLNFYSNVIEVLYNSPDFNESSFRNFFIHKDRLWIVTEGAVYFSAPTIFTDFSVDAGGGFFRFPGDSINYGMAVGENLYILCDSAIHSLVYADNPNDDAVVRKISSNIGGLHGCSFRGEAYFINNEGIFLINNNFVEKVLNSNFDEGLNNFPRQTLNAFNNYLIVNKTYEDNIDGFEHPSIFGSDYGVRINKFINPSLDSALGAEFVAGPSTSISIVTGAVGTPFGTKSLEINNTVAYSHATIPVSRYAATSSYELEPGKVYAVSAYVGRPVTSDAKTGLISQTSYVDGVPTADSIEVISYTPIVLPVAGAAWGRVSFTFRSITATSIVFSFGATGLNWLLNEDINFDGFMFEESSTVGTYFDKSTTDTDTWVYSEGVDGESVALNPLFQYYHKLFPYMYSDGDDPYGNDLGYNLYFIDMDSGSSHVVDYKPFYDDDTDEYVGYISEVVVNSNQSVDKPGASVFFQTSDRYSDNLNDLANNYFVYMLSEEETFTSDDIRDDVVYKASVSQIGETTTDKIRYDIEISGYTPDGNEYVIKKFRTVELMGNLPKDSFEVVFAFDNSSYGTPRTLVDDSSLLVSGEYRPHIPHRIGVNQRGRSINIRLKSNSIKPTDVKGSPFEISNIRILWAYTQRPAKYASFNPAV